MAVRNFCFTQCDNITYGQMKGNYSISLRNILSGFLSESTSHPTPSEGLEVNVSVDLSVCKPLYKE